MGGGPDWLETGGMVETGGLVAKRVEIIHNSMMDEAPGSAYFGSSHVSLP